MPASRIGLAVPTMGSIDVQVVSRLFHLKRPLNCTVTPCWPVGMATAVAREKAVESVKGAGYSHIFFLDYDVVLPDETLTVLAAHDKPIVCGLYYTKTKPPQPLTIIDKQTATDWTHGEILTVDVTGLGCALIDLSVFDKLERPWFQSGSTDDGTRYTEDAYFYRRLKDATGIRPMVDTGLCCAHKELSTGELFFWDRETGKPTWMGLDGEKHTLTKESETE